jgi:hypothetical protein
VKAVTLMHTRQYDTAADSLLTADERARLAFSLASHPQAHPTIAGAAGARKARWGRAGMGKRGGIRVIYYYALKRETVLLIAAYAKNVQENIGNDQKKAIRQLVQDFEKSFPG